MYPRAKGAPSLGWSSGNCWDLACLVTSINKQQARRGTVAESQTRTLQTCPRLFLFGVPHRPRPIAPTARAAKLPASNWVSVIPSLRVGTLIIWCRGNDQPSGAFSRITPTTVC